MDLLNLMEIESLGFVPKKEDTLMKTEIYIFQFLLNINLSVAQAEDSNQ